MGMNYQRKRAVLSDAHRFLVRCLAPRRLWLRLGGGVSAYARKMVVLTLLLGVLFLGSLGAYVWYGTVQFLKLP